MADTGLKVRVLGTGTSQGIPVIGCKCAVCMSADSRDRRLRTSILIESATTRFTIDIGPDFRQQLLHAGVDDIDAIVLTHEHNDHVSGLDEIRPINFIHKKDIPMYGLQRVLGEVMRRFPYIFDDAGYPGRPKVQLIEINSDFFQIGDIGIQPVQVMHGPLPILGFRIRDFCYITDAKSVTNQQVERLKGLNTLIINALHRKRHFSHLNLDEAISLVSQIGPKRAFLTHLSHDMGLHADVENELPDHIGLAYDGLVLEA